MSTTTAETLFQQIVRLPPLERIKLLQMLSQKPETLLLADPPTNGFSVPRQMPDSTREFRWIAEHTRDYAGQWVALDGNRLIAHSLNHDEVWAKAEADGAYLPLITRVPDPEAPPFAGF